MIPARRSEARRTYARTVESFAPVAWRVPTTARFDGRIANDEQRTPAFIDELRDLPAWAHIIGGGMIAALAGALLGGALHI